MQKKSLKFVPKTIWIIVVLITPTIILLIPYYFMYDYFMHADFPAIVSIAYFYLPPILLTGIGICVVLFVWKKPYSLYALSFGFLISPISCSMALYYAGGRYWHNFNGSEIMGGADFAIILLGAMYAVPFATASLLPVFIKSYRRKNSLANKAVNTTESEDSNESVK